MKYVVLFIVCLFISFYIVESLFPGYQGSLGQSGKAVLSFAIDANDVSNVKNHA